MKNKALWKAIATFLGGPAAGAFGIWLLAEAPFLHQSMCNPMGSVL